MDEKLINENEEAVSGTVTGTEETEETFIEVKTGIRGGQDPGIGDS